MIRLNIIGEGPTEETFVRDVLAPHFAPFEIYAVARSIETSRRRGVIRRGGITNYAKAKGDIERWLKQDQSAYVTTMLDLYGLPDSFPGLETAKKLGEPIAVVEAIEQALSADIPERRFLPYVQLHEFEALLFADVDVIDSVLSPDTGQSKLRDLVTIRDCFSTPEHINDNPNTAPSKRILKLYPGYQKPVHGSRILGRIGVASLRKKCPHFESWLSRIEALKQQ
jgi:hypothetical protein